MHRFELWTPFAERVELVLGQERLDMERDSTRPASRPGWWARQVPEAGPGSEYQFSLDGGPPRPDPRSRCQPAGIDGPSRVVDEGAYRWNDSSWQGLDLSRAVLYELHVGTFTPEGTFAAAAGRLEHLVRLGVDAVELLPVAEASGRHGWGYDGVDWFAPHHAYGGPEGMKAFVDAAHQAGLGVVLDVVYNHLGPAGNYLAEFGPYFTDRYRTNWGQAINFDGAYADEVRELVIDNALMWLEEYHCDGLRLDAVHAISDRSARHVLEQLSDEVRRALEPAGRPVFLVAESDLNDPRFVREPAAGGYGLEAAWADEFHHALHAVLTGERSGYYEDFGSLAQLATALQQGWVYAGEWSPHRKRRHGRPPEGLRAEQFVVFLQNHDQVGNRAAGERIGALAGFDRAKVGAALYLLSGFVPLLFQGEEWFASTPFQYFTDHADPELARAVSEGRRSEFAAFGWSPEEVPDPQDEATFAASKLRWSELAREEHAEMLEWYRSLIALRKETPGLAGGELAATATLFDEVAGWMVFCRAGLVVAANLGQGEVVLGPAVLPAGELLLSSSEDAGLSPEGLRLPPASVAVLRAAAC